MCKQNIRMQSLQTEICCCYVCDFRPSVVLGVTNPFFAKTLQHWPHVIRIGEISSNGKKTNPHLAIMHFTEKKGSEI